MNYNNIAQKIEELIKQDIKDKQLIDTGAMYNSVTVTSTGDGDYDIKSTDYFEIVSYKYDILKDVFNSTELSVFIEEEYVKFINSELE